LKRLALVTLTACLVVAAPAPAATLDFGRQTWNILPPGQSGVLPPDAHSTDQLPRYDRLTALPGAWRSDATGERIRFAPGALGATMRWANRPTFHQLMEFGGHR
jgi:hypothetical protein